MNCMKKEWRDKFDILLYLSKNQHKKNYINDLTKFLKMSHSNINRSINWLESNNLINKKKSGRLVELVPTKTGLFTAVTYEETYDSIKELENVGQEGEN